MEILDQNISNSDYSEIMFSISHKLKSRNLFSFLNINAYILTLSKKDKELQNNLKKFSELFADGTGIYLASRLIYGKSGLRKRITGTDLYYKILALAEEQSYKVFFFGGGEKAVSILKNRLLKEFPKLCISKVIGRQNSFDEELVARINEVNADILFLGLGTPLQEEFIATYSNKINIPIQIAVGSGIEFLSGNERRAPIVMRKLGLEWSYRVLRNPRRLLLRYLTVIPGFMLSILKQKLRVDKQSTE